jgi:PAS domain S-box-containing protein
MSKDIESSPSFDSISSDLEDITKETPSIGLIRNRIVNITLLIACILVLPSLIFSLVRSQDYGWHPIYFLHTGLTALVIATFIFRHRLSFRLRSSLLLIMLYSSGIASLFVYGLVGNGTLLLATLAILTTVFRGTLAGLISVAISLATIAACGIAFCMGSIEYSSNISQYLLSNISWSLAFAVFGLLAAMFVICVGRVNDYLNQALLSRSQYTAHLEVLNRRLRQEVKERQLSDQALKVSEDRYRILAENVIDVIWITDMDLNVTYISPSVEKLRGFTPDEAMGQSLNEILTPESLNYAFQILQNEQENIASGSAAPQTMELKFFHKNGSRVMTETTINVYYDQNKQPLYFMGVSRDISERKRNQEQQRTLEAQIQHVQKLESLGVLAGGIAHDFNNLLVAILGNAELAQTKLSDTTPAANHIGEIIKTSNQAADLCRQLLAYSGKGRFVVETLDISQVVKEMADILDVSISKKVVLRYDFAKKLSPIEADTVQLRQVIMNLITNASDAIGDNTGTISIKTGEMECVADYLAVSYLNDDLPEGVYSYIEVTDSGCGMDKETQAKLFEPFFTTKFVGRGLGLAAVLGIVRGHKGAIKVYSEVGKGSTFKVLFPACKDSALVAAKKEPVKESDIQHWQSSGKVLLADDEEVVRNVSQKMLEIIGFEVLTASDGLEAVELFSKYAEEIVCVLLDLTMPKLDGSEVFNRIRQIRSDIKVILCSGYNQQEATQRFVGKGLANFIQKPYRMHSLIATLKEVLDS